VHSRSIARAGRKFPARLLGEKIMDIYQNILNENTLQEAQEILSTTPLPNQEAVDALLEGVIAPVRKPFETPGIAPGISPTAAEPSNQE
jgi:hypothetical protein